MDPSRIPVDVSVTRFTVCTSKRCRKVRIFGLRSRHTGNDDTQRVVHTTPVPPKVRVYTTATPVIRRPSPAARHSPPARHDVINR
eukprot:9360059-Pyramimonas_sp.AAC.2